MRTVRTLGLLVVVAATAFLSLAADAQTGFGLRAGATVDPDQFHVGFQLDLGEIAPRLRFQPSVDIGFGSAQTTLVGNMDVLYLFEGDNTVRPFAGGGLGVGARWRNGRSSDGLIGANLIGGIEWGTRPTPHVAGTGSSIVYSAEARLGVGDLPAFRLTLSLNF